MISFSNHCAYVVPKSNVHIQVKTATDTDGEQMPRILMRLLGLPRRSHAISFTPKVPTSLGKLPT